MMMSSDKISKEEKEQGRKSINELLDYIKNKESITISEYNELKTNLEMVTNIFTSLQSNKEWINPISFAQQ